METLDFAGRNEAMCFKVFRRDIYAVHVVDLRPSLEGLAGQIESFCQGIPSMSHSHKFCLLLVKNIESVEGVNPEMESDVRIPVTPRFISVYSFSLHPYW